MNWGRLLDDAAACPGGGFGDRGMASGVAQRSGASHLDLGGWHSSRRGTMRWTDSCGGCRGPLPDAYGGECGGARYHVRASSERPLCRVSRQRRGARHASEIETLWGEWNSAALTGVDSSRLDARETKIFA